MVRECASDGSEKTNLEIISQFSKIFSFRFAELQSRFAIALVLKNFKLSLDRKTKVPLEFRKDYPGWSVIDGIWLNVERVTSNSGVSTSL